MYTTAFAIPGMAVHRWANWPGPPDSLDKALNQLIAEEGDPAKITKAQQALTEADNLRSIGAFEDAVNEY